MFGTRHGREEWCGEGRRRADDWARRRRGMQTEINAVYVKEKVKDE